MDKSSILKLKTIKEILWDEVDKADGSNLDDAKCNLFEAHELIKNTLKKYDMYKRKKVLTG